MKEYELLLFENIIYSGIAFLVFLIGAIGFFMGRNVFNGFTKIDTKNKIVSTMATKVLPLVIILMAIWYSGSPVLDFITKDYIDKKGILFDLNAPYNSITEELLIEGETERYYLPRGLLKTEKIGTEYRFKYGKWSRFILEIEEVKK